MTIQEKNFLIEQFLKVNKENWVFTDHSLIKFRKRNIKLNHFLTLWEKHNLIEYHKKGDSHRILLRGQVPHQKRHVCSVFDITDKKIVTCWTSWEHNNHDNLVESEYMRDFNILDGFSA